MEPGLLTDPALAAVLAELSAREPIFHRPEHDTTRADYERMTDERFGKWARLAGATAATHLSADVHAGPGRRPHDPAQHAMAPCG
jgi:hypothetical protein